MLLHPLQTLKVAPFRRSFRQILRPLTILKMLNHLGLGDWLLAKGALLDVFDAVVVV